MMGDAELARLLDYLKEVKGWTDAEIVDLLHYIATGKLK